jgi:2-polyprenyl-3-methyl-5-hydroxy-6-metoxy-1,4-benzoquinol methylase
MTGTLSAPEHDRNTLSGAVKPVYDHYYYSQYQSNEGVVAYDREEEVWLQFFGSIADRTVLEIVPKTVLDAGCAKGFLVEALRDRGVEAYGVDISEYAVSQVRQDVRPFCTVASVTDPFPLERYDLIFCIETLEHLETSDAERAVANICSYTDDVIFTSSPTHFKEVTHLNVRPPEYWAQLFGNHGLFRDPDHDASAYIAPWAVRYRRRGDPPARIAAGYERLHWHLKNENRELRELAIEQDSRLADAHAKVRDAEAKAEATLDEWKARAEIQLHRAEALRAALVEARNTSVRRVALRILPAGTRRGDLVRTVRRRFGGGHPAEG